MSRSKHQHHPLSRGSKMPLSKHWKTKPEGLEFAGPYGGEAYFHSKSGRYSHKLNGEYIFPVINKAKARRESKNQCKNYED